MNSINRPSIPLMLVGCILGSMFSLGVLSGDGLGRVNVLYLLFVFWLMPILSITLSVVSLLRTTDFSFARIVSMFKIWPTSFQQTLRIVHQNKLSQYWFFMQSHCLALAYSVGCITSLFTLLAVSDINFVWRSTLINEQHLFSLLKVISSPWLFWDAAQPSQELIRITQDNRLISDYVNVVEYGKWWPFFFATQVFYGLVLRGGLFIFSNRLLSFKLSKISQQKKPSSVNKIKHNMADIPTNTSPTSALNTEMVIANWANFPISSFSSFPCEVLTTISYETLIELCTQQQVDKLPNGNILVLVKSWEPPLGELSDLLVQTHGLICPAELKNNILSSPSKKHLIEWQRFANDHTGWELYQPSQWHVKGMINNA